MTLHGDTIFALSSGRGRAGVAVVRVSGPGAAAAVRLLAGAELPTPRKAVLRKIVSRTGEPIDDGLLLWFPAPASLTGEDVAEFHIHGGRAVVEALLRTLGEIAGLRPAEAGEFTRRAVENGKFDLTQAEALADLINAETEAQRRQALRQYDGALADLYEDWRQRLIRAAAWIEAAIDFTEEEIPAEALVDSKKQVTEIVAEIRAHLNDSRRGEILREGFHLTVIGPPNSGKSSLINAFARRDAAIVSEIPGTTRDVLEVHLDLGGYPVILADTAGFREAVDRIEAEGVRRALARSEAADAVLLLLDATSADAALPALPQAPTLTVWNKIDVAAAPHGAISVSVRTGAGMEALLSCVRNIVTERLENGGVPVLSRERYRHALSGAADALQASLEASEPEIIAEEMRVAMRELGRITGRVNVEELLDVVFQDFCIGK
jgi:tRNA modification GTPase